MNTEFTSIYLKLSGDEISPENVRIDMLMGVLGGLERAIEAMASSLGIEFDANEAIVSLGSLEYSSLGIISTLNPKAKAPAQEIDRAFYANEFESLPMTVRSELQGIQKTLSSRGVQLDMSSAELGLESISLSADAPKIEVEESDGAAMTAHAVVYGICMRINRSKSDARIQLHDGNGCTLTGLNDEQIQHLMKATGENLEQVFRIEGQATWSLDDYQVRQIEVAAIQSVERNVKEFFRGLRKASGTSFDGVDPIEYVNELRGK